MKILLTGASSYVGARLYLDLSRDFEVIGTCHSTKLSSSFVELDITDAAALEDIVRQFQPEIIIHAAANANARWCEANPELAISLNQTATQNLVSVANKHKEKIILISSYAAINPINVYGKTKAQSEEYVESTSAGFAVLRPSLIIGMSPNTINDRPFNRILKNLDQGTKAEYDTSWKFQPSHLGHISEVIRIIIQKEIWNEIISIAVQELKSRFDIASDILSQFGVSVVPFDAHDTTPIIEGDLGRLKKLKLPQYSYREIIDKIVQEIKDRESFNLD